MFTDGPLNNFVFSWRIEIFSEGPWSLLRIVIYYFIILFSLIAMSVWVGPAPWKHEFPSKYIGFLGEANAHAHDWGFFWFLVRYQILFQFFQTLRVGCDHLLWESVGVIDLLTYLVIFARNGLVSSAQTSAYLQH